MPGFFVRSPFASLAVALFKSYPALFIVNLLIVMTDSFDFSTFSPVKIEFGFSICELDSLMYASSVTLLAPVYDSSSYSVMTFNIASRIFTLDHVNLLFSLKVVMVLLSSV